MSNENTNKKIFPPPYDNDYTKLKYDSEGLWSLSHIDDAEIISNKILEYVDCNSTILDSTSGCGGNLISFSKYFNNITGVEINKTRFDMLVNNLNCYNYNKINIINDDCLSVMNNNFDVYFFDPPWGGPKYKKHEIIELYLSNKPLISILKNIKNHKLIVIKVPFNYNTNEIEEHFEILEKFIKGNIVYLFFK
jgi:16S rRNA G966 N2-methylase RsmD